ncbi:nucleoside triphosphate hydrolase protein [Wolfiporia cocos MD-104 SS10]|uniref:Nucleoside triphosphate hydrolase protein n=1 Tax=Wolfiporia cocos (strain MD-104) TaxID=742152 RepID=A0A2H3JDP9_WOLCO|nr:nucleoside triphosphate hydrolase protein [Wolfiporia cocos MD-104 SS10]
MSEELRKPLYIVGAADLGTNAESLDNNLTRVFKVAATWGAVCLIDEADVFLEERSLQFIERNAMVAVFLRQLDPSTHRYFRGILLLTTNRVRVFDEALQSRIHISIRYSDLTPEVRRQIWLAFLRKVNGDVSNGGVTEEELAELGEKDVNGRQIKNVVKMAGALAAEEFTQRIKLAENTKLANDVIMPVEKEGESTPSDPKNS